MQEKQTKPLTLFDKLWQRHLVDVNEDGESLLYIDRHLVYEVTSPQAFEGLRLSSRRPWRASTVLATVDHNVPTVPEQRISVDHIADPLSRLQVKQLGINCEEFGITQFGLGQIQQGIIHVIGPELGATLPGMTVVAGDSHTSTHGAFGALAFGVGTSGVEHVLATQCLVLRPMKRMLLKIEGELRPGVGPKDLILHIIGQIGTAGATGYAIEFSGGTIRGMSMEAA
uniref:3-isopropylmalate dehydratase n=1 Tax=Aquipseudomonas alcaligenes TaxID=43263 RepID=Q0QFQ7_AQUAC|nr:unknown [Pseudomonas alcaligenes]